MPLPTGYIPDSYDPADIVFTSDVTPQPSVNISVEHPDWLKEVYNQANSNSCVANATAAAFRFLANIMNGTGNKHQLNTEPSRLFIYYNARELPFLPNTPEVTDEGSVNRYAMKSLKNFGVCSESTWQFIINPDNSVLNVNTKPKDEAYIEAQGVQVLKYCRLDPDYPDEEEPDASEETRNAAGSKTLHNLKQCLSEGYPVVFGFRYYWEEPPFVTDNTPGGYWVLPDLPPEQRHKMPPRKPDGTSYGGHCVLAIGYDDAQQKVLCQNSWDKDWSKDGLFWITYDWITDWEATNDFWTLRVIQTDG
jgi:C1A family cysteine protease